MKIQLLPLVVCIAMLITGFSGCAPAADAGQEPEQAGVRVQPVSLDSPPPPPVRDTVVPEPIDSFPLAVLIGKINQAQDTNFVEISSAYTAKSKIYLRREAYQAWKRMHAAAKAEGIHLSIVSAMRNFDYQKGIWERKWTGATKVGGRNLAQAEPDPEARALTILRYSSMPGTSRHHWGTDIDINSLDNGYFESGTGKAVYEWLRQHAAEYGFCQTYSPMGADRPHGYQEEKWHWSYMPIAARYLEAYQRQVGYGDIAGFKGAEAAEGIDVIAKYVGGIAPSCLNWE